MNKIGVKLKVDVSKINKDLLFTGSKGVYLDATVFVDINEPDQYGNNGMIVQDVSQEARQAGNKGPILGNVKVFWKDGNAPQQAPQSQGSEFSASGEEEESIPF